jgi:hypothetical protein
VDVLLLQQQQHVQVLLMCRAPPCVQLCLRLLKVGWQMQRVG